jgi:hypothetical protein
MRKLAFDLALCIAIGGGFGVGLGYATKPTPAYGQTKSPSAADEKALDDLFRKLAVIREPRKPVKKHVRGN